MDEPVEEVAPRVRCRACGARVLPGRFCSDCGLALPTIGRCDDRCTSCGAQLAPGARYCTDCGNPADGPRARSGS